MMNLKILEVMKKELPWKEFLDSMIEQGFQISNSLSSLNRTLLSSGKIILVNNYITSSIIRDPSLLHLSPYVIFRPINEEQLRKIVITSYKYSIPITFASGKTGLSGGFANFGILVDLEDLHSQTEPIFLDIGNKKLYAEQCVLVSDLIKLVHFKSNGKLMFPVRPASSYNLPVRVGGLISSNASGITSGKLGAAEDWIIDMRVIIPKGDVIMINGKEKLFHRIVGGNGFYGIVLSANFKLYQPEIDLERAILFGDNLNSAFIGLQKVLDSKIFPLISEFVTSPIKLPGEFSKLTSSDNTTLKVNWATLIKGKTEIINKFISIMKNESGTYYMNLTEEEFQKYMQERSTFALLVQTSEEDADYIAFPGFEDILSLPKYLPDIIKTINSIFIKKGFHQVIFGYGHINFRKGKGLLLHIRLPVPIHYFYRENSDLLIQICETVYEVIVVLKNKYQIQYKAEHSAGPFEIWLSSEFRKNLERDIRLGYAFNNPHLLIYNKLKADLEENYSNNLEKDLFISSMRLYLD